MPRMPLYYEVRVQNALVQAGCDLARDTRPALKVTDLCQAMALTDYLAAKAAEWHAQFLADGGTLASLPPDSVE
jgi:hypothetical protein